MPMKMGIHCKSIGHSHSASLDSLVRGNDGGMFFPRERLKLEGIWSLFCPLPDVAIMVTKNELKRVARESRLNRCLNSGVAESEYDFFREAAYPCRFSKKIIPLASNTFKFDQRGGKAGADSPN